MYFLCASLYLIRCKILTWGENQCVFFSLFVICCSICTQNTSLILVNETTAGNSMRLNPHIQYYSTVYVVSMGAALLLKTMRGLVFVKVSFPHPRNSHLSLVCLLHKMSTMCQVKLSP